MGATTFSVTAQGKTAKDAFNAAVAEAKHEYGHGGYTGSIAEKHSFKTVYLPELAKLTRKSEAWWAVIYAAEEKGCADGGRFEDKWGPAGCVELGEGEFYFFGWASE